MRILKQVQRIQADGKSNPDPRPMVIWRPDYVREMESVYSVFRNFRKLNAFAAGTAISIISEGKKNDASELGYSYMCPCIPKPRNGFESSQIKEIAQNLGIEGDLDWPEMNKEAMDHFTTREFRWCPECQKYGYHSWLYQCRKLERCPIHSIAFETGIRGNGLWCDNVGYHPGLHPIDPTPLKEAFKQVFDDCNRLYLIRFDNPFIVKRKFKLNTVNDLKEPINAQIYTSGKWTNEDIERYLNTGIPKPKLVIEHMRKEYDRQAEELFERETLNEPGGRLTSENIFDNSFFRFIRQKRDDQVLAVETDIMRLQASLTIMKLVNRNKESNFHFYGENVYKPEFYKTPELCARLKDFARDVLGGNPGLDIRRFYSYDSSTRTDFCRSPAYIPPTLPYEQWDKLVEESRPLLACIEDLILTQWRLYMKALGEHNMTRPKEREEALNGLPGILYAITDKGNYRLFSI